MSSQTQNDMEQITEAIKNYKKGEKRNLIIIKHFLENLIAKAETEDRDNEELQTILINLGKLQVHQNLVESKNYIDSVSNLFDKLTNLVKQPGCDCQQSNQTHSSPTDEEDNQSLNEKERRHSVQEVGLLNDDHDRKLDDVESAHVRENKGRRPNGQKPISTDSGISEGPNSHVLSDSMQPPIQEIGDNTISSTSTSTSTSTTSPNTSHEAVEHEENLRLSEVSHSS